MTIKDSFQLKDIQEQFNAKFPYLKIEFYKNPHAKGGGSPIREQLSPNLVLSEVRIIHAEGELSIHANQKISTLEQAFLDQYGLSVQVFRRSANLWLQTSKTDHWTLKEANIKGEHSVELTQDKIYPN